MVSAEERADRAGAPSRTPCLRAVAVSSKVTSQHYVKVTDAHAIVVGTWGIAGTEWRRTHCGCCSRGEGSSYVDIVVSIPDDILQAVEA